MGVTHLVMTRPHYQRRGIGRELLSRAEEYLRSRGAGVLYAGGVGHLNGFYLGMYGGSEMPGVLDSSPAAQQFFLAAGYREIDQTLVLHRETATFHPPVDRRVMQLRRTAAVRAAMDPPATSWWDACTMGIFAQARFDVDLKDAVKGAAIGKVAHTGPLKLTAPMPGKIVKVLVAPGEAVEAGRGVLVMEAMKMENELKVSRAGAVQEIKVKEGQAVEMGALLLVIG